MTNWQRFNFVTRLSMVLVLAISFCCQSQVKAQQDEPDDDPVSEVKTSAPKGLLFSGRVPKSIEELRFMETHVAELSERVFPATVNIQMGGSQGSGVVVSSDGYILTAAHVIGNNPGDTAVITFMVDGKQKKIFAETLGVQAGAIDCGMLKIKEGAARYRWPRPTRTARTRRPTRPNADEKKESDSEDKKDDKDKDDEDKDDEGKKDKDEKDKEAEPPAPARPAINFSRADIKKQDRFEGDFPFVDIGVSQDLKLGQWVVAIGHPGGIDPKRGLVVRVGRIIDNRKTSLRTDCTLVGGDSGGPLFDMNGDVIGIHSRIGQTLADNLHVPSDIYAEKWDLMAASVLINARGTLGFSTNDDTNVIKNVVKNGPAEKAGMKAGDVLVKMGTSKISNKKDITDAFRTSEVWPNKIIKVVVERDDEKKTIKIKAGKR